MDADAPGESPTATYVRRAEDRLRQWVLTGIAITVPLIVTVVVLSFAIGFVSNLLDPVVGGAAFVIGIEPPLGRLAVRVVALCLLVAGIVGVGFVADVTEQDRADRFHRAVEAIPGVGSIYSSFRRMSDVFVENDAQSFQEVKLVEFPNDGAYSLAFVTATPPQTLQEAAGHADMHTLFVPLAPNPVMGGFLVHVRTDRVHDIDMTVEEAIQATITSGVSVSTAGRERDRPVSMESISDMAEVTVDDTFDTDERRRD